MLEHWSRLLPVNRLYETENLLAFYHPQPSYAVHILIVPKKAIPSMVSLVGRADGFSELFVQDLLHCVNELVIELGLEVRGYRLIVNGGAYQDIPELHFHLVSGESR